MQTEVTTTLTIVNNKINQPVFLAWLKTVPLDAELTFVISPGHDDRFSYSPDTVTGIKATWKVVLDV